MIQLTKEKIEAIVKKAFKDGENWGLTYSTWFTPDEHDHKERLDKTITELNNMLENEQL